MKIQLKKNSFTDKESLFAEAGELKAYLYRYESGICAVKLSNSKGYISVLPFNGQMIWDAVMNGRSLKMETSYTMPQNCELFRYSYGCYLMHCGMLTMGCPSPQDTHAHHGELPYAKYDRAYLLCGEDEKGKYLAVSGDYEYNLAFGDHYIARPCVKLYEGSTLMDVSMDVHNLSRQAMDLMYMCHINNAAEADAELFQTLEWDSKHMVARLSVPQYNEVEPSFLNLLDRVQNDVSVTRIITKDDLYDPEIVLFLRGVKGDENRKAHFLYQHKDGSSDYSSYDINQLNRGVRWMVYHKDWKSMGMVLPSTAEPEGYLAEKEKGNLRRLPSGEHFETKLTIGYLSPEETETKKKQIEKIMN